MEHEQKTHGRAGSGEPGFARSSLPSIGRRRLLLLVLALGLGLVGVARHTGARLQAEAHTAIRAELDANGLTWTQLTVAGRRAHLNGSVPAMGDGGRALEIVRGVECEMWIFTVACASAVTADFGVSRPGAEVWPDLLARVDGGVLTLGGQVGDRATLEVVLKAARSGIQAHGLTRVVDNLRITETDAPSGSQPLLKRLTSALALCQSGEARLSQGAASLSCELDRERETSVRDLLASPLPAGTLGELSLLVAEDS